MKKIYFTRSTLVILEVNTKTFYNHLLYGQYGQIILLKFLTGTNCIFEFDKGFNSLYLLDLTNIL